MWSVELANSIMKQFPNLEDYKCLSIMKSHHNMWSYVHGVYLKGLEAVWKGTNDPKYFDYIKRNMDAIINEECEIRDYVMEEFNIDFINNAKVPLMLYKETGEERYKKAIQKVRYQLNYHPKTADGVYWHKLIYPYQIWLDGLYMGGPFLNEYISLFGDESEYDFLAHQFKTAYQRLHDERTGLLYHAYDERKVQKWCDPVTGLSKSFWTRSIGWTIMALVDVLETFPKVHKDREELHGLLIKILSALRTYQHESGCWYQVTDQGGREGNYLESSGTCMVLYTLMKGIRLGLLDPTWKEMADRTYQGIIENFITKDPDGKVEINGICSGAGLGQPDHRDGSFEYYCNEPIVKNDFKGIGAFLMAAAEVELLQQTA